MLYFERFEGVNKYIKKVGALDEKYNRYMLEVLKDLLRAHSSFSEALEKINNGIGQTLQGIMGEDKLTEVYSASYNVVGKGIQVMLNQSKEVFNMIKYRVGDPFQEIVRDYSLVFKSVADKMNNEIKPLVEKATEANKKKQEQLKKLEKRDLPEEKLKAISLSIRTYEEEVKMHERGCSGRLSSQQKASTKWPNCSPSSRSSK